MPEMSNAVLCQYRKSISSDKRWDSMIDLRIHMIGPPCKHNARISGLLEPFDGLFALFPHILLESVKSGVCSLCCLLCLLLRNSIFPEFLHDLLRHEVRFVESYKEVDEFDPLFLKNIHIIFDDFRIRGHDRTIVMIIGIVKLLAFKRNAGIEDTFDALFREILCARVSIWPDSRPYPKKWSPFPFQTWNDWTDRKVQHGIRVS